MDGEAGASARFALPRIPERGREAPFGIRWVSPRGPEAPRRSPSGRSGRTCTPPSLPLADPARLKAAPSPQARIEAEASPVARFEKRWGRSLPAFRGISRGRSLWKSRWIATPPEGLAVLQEPDSKAEAFSSNPFGWRLGPEPFPVSPSARAAGRFPRPSPLRRAFQLRGAFRRRPGGFVIRLASACAYAARLRPLPVPSASCASVLGGARAPSAWGCGLRFDEPSPVRRRSGHIREAVSFARFGKGESTCG